MRYHFRAKRQQKSLALNAREASQDIPDDIAAWRKQQRARLLDARRAMPLDTHQAAGEHILREAARHLAPRADILVGCYWPFRREPNCIPYMREVLAAGGRVALPVVIARGEPLEFRCWTETAAMEAGVWNIPHPAEGPPVNPDALIVPLVGFDEAGFRLGYGAGYYDATLAALSPRPFTMGVGYEFSRLRSIYPQAHDVPLDIIVTEERTRDFRVRPTDKEQERGE